MKSLLPISLRVQGLLVIVFLYSWCLRKAVDNRSNMKLEPSRLVQYSQSYLRFSVPFLVPVLLFLFLLTNIFCSGLAGMPEPSVILVLIPLSSVPMSDDSVLWS